MATPDEQRALQLKYAEKDAGQWNDLRDISAEYIEGHKQLIDSARRTIAATEEAKEYYAAQVAAANERLARLGRGGPLRAFKSQ